MLARTHDRELVSRLVTGDESALRAVYREHAAAVFGLAERVLANSSLAEEVTQDVFVRLWERPERFDPTRGTLRAYLLATTHSRAVERVRAEDSMRRRHDDASRQRAVTIVDEPERLAVDNATRAAVQAALAALPADQRVAIEMAYFEGLSYREVATKLAQPEGTVKYRIRMGLQKMRAALQSVEVAP